MKQNSSWETNSSLASQEIRRVVRNPRLQEPATFPILSHILPVHALPSHFLKIHLNIPSSTPRSTKPPVRSSILTKTLYTPLPRTRYVASPSHSSPFYHLNNIWWGVQVIQLLVMYLSPPTCHLIPLKPKCLSSALFSKPSVNFSPSMWATKFHTHYNTTGKSAVLYFLIFIFLDSSVKT